MRLTRSNGPPLDAEIDSAQAMIASYEAELQSIQSEEAHMKAFILDMERQASAVQKMVDAVPQERERISEATQQRKRLLSPMRRLSPEIVSQAMKGGINFGDSAHAYMRRLGRQLSHSGGSSALLSLAASHDDSQSSSSDSTQIPPTLMALLFPLAGRIQELHLTLPSRMFEGIPSLQLSLPSLKTLGLTLTDGEAIDDHQSLQLFSSTPNLRTLDIVDVKR
ncbi:hypothetical protein ARMGADRAFT_1077914 [Armillaria gallica]|uniref:Uncharacterized protein n=1 Tax=Armillaria gallica TaxID=47427 RepID=A0A2H3DIU8_ARMGA|nr:hypothetical protein ARMGADRAFT_1077914 [Armillaria gallica]